MPQLDGSISKEAAAAFARNLKWLRTREGISQKDLEAQMKQRGLKSSQKSVSNIENQKHSSGIHIYQAMADRYGVPLWVMFIPCDPSELLEPEKLKRVIRLMNDYLVCDELQREHVANMAAGFAALKRP